MQIQRDRSAFDRSNLYAEERMPKTSGTRSRCTLLSVLTPLALLACAAIGILAGVPSSAAEDVAAIDPAPQTDQTAAKTSSPEEVVETFHAGLLELMKHAKELGFQGRIDELDPLMAQTFDLEFMASKTVGSHWRRLSDAEKARWVRVFTDLTTANYAGRFTGFKGEEFVTLGTEDAARNTQLVLTKIIVPDDDDVQLNYRLLQVDGEWKVIDVYLNGTVSELALRRSEYSSALKREGFEELVAAVETKIADLKAKGEADG
jgi:phospholipid transport system substrate-binding protein